MEQSRRIDGLIVYGVIYLGFLYLPILLIPLFSFNDSIYIAFPLKGFTLQWYEAMIAQDALVRSLVNSLKVASAVAVVSTIFGTLAAKAVTSYNLRGKAPIVAFIMIPFVIPGIILGISLLVLINRLGVTPSLLTVGLGHVMIAIPFSMMVMISRLEGLDRDLEGGVHGSRRGGVVDLLEGHLSSRAAGNRRQSAAHLHPFLRRVPDRVLPHRQGGDAADIPFFLSSDSPRSCPTCWRSVPAFWPLPPS